MLYGLLSLKILVSCLLSMGKTSCVRVNYGSGYVTIAVEEEQFVWKESVSGQGK